MFWNIIQSVERILFKLTGVYCAHTEHFALENEIYLSFRDRWNGTNSRNSEHLYYMVIWALQRHCQ